MVEHGWIDEAAFEKFTFTNPVRFYTGTNPGFFKGTVVRGGRRPLPGRGLTCLTCCCGAARSSTAPGAPGSAADVGVRDGRIVAVGRDRRGRRAGPSTSRARSSARGSSTSIPTTTPSCCGTRRPTPRSSTASPPCSGATAGSRSPRSGPDDAAYIQRMMAVVEGIPLEALESVGAWDVGLVRRSTSTRRPGPGRQRRLPRRALDRPARRHGRRRHPGQRHAPSSSRPWCSWWRSRWPGGRSASRPRSAKATSTVTAGPVPSRAASLERVRGPGRRPARPPRHHPRVHPHRRSHPRGADGAHGRHVAGGRPAPQLEPARQPGVGGDLRAAAAGVRRGRRRGAPTWSPWPCPT